MKNCIVGGKYWRIPKMYSGIAVAPLANNISGTAVITPDNNKYINVSVPKEQNVIELFDERYPM